MHALGGLIKHTCVTNVIKQTLEFRVLQFNVFVAMQNVAIIQLYVLRENAKKQQQHRKKQQSQELIDFVPVLTYLMKIDRLV